MGGETVITLLVDVTSGISLLVHHRGPKWQKYDVKVFSIKVGCDVPVLSHHWFQTQYLEKPKPSINQQSLILFWAMKKEIIEARSSKWILNPRKVSSKLVKICIESQDLVTGPTSCSKQVFRAGCTGQWPDEFWISSQWNLSSLSEHLFWCLTACRMENFLPYTRAEFPNFQLVFIASCPFIMYLQTMWSQPLYNLLLSSYG